MEFAFDTGGGQTMNLNDDEKNLLDEISIQPAERKTVAIKPKPRASPFSKRAPGPGPMSAGPDDGMDMFMNPGKRSTPAPPPPEEFDGGEEDYEEEAPPPEGYQGGGSNVPSEGYKTIEDEKADLLNKINRLNKKGIASSQRLTIYSDIEEIRTEYKRITYSIEAEQSIKFSRRMLIACVTGVEFLNKRYNPFDIMLEGWSESVMENVDDYDGVFEELYVKYRAKMHVAPEIKLMMMLGGSGMMFHLTHSMFKAAMPNLNEVMKQNPDLVQNMMQAVKNTQQPANGVREDTSQRPMASPTMRGGGDGTSSRREMQGPGLDISSLMGGIMMPPPPPMNTKPQILEVVPEEGDGEGDDISDIISVSGESLDTKDIKVTPAKRKGRKKKSNEVSL
jgi:hypothetical protein